MTLSKNQTFLCLLGLWGLVSGPLIAEPGWASEGVRLQTFKTHSRLVIKVDESVPVDWKNHGKGFEILLKGINLGDLGAPLGEERRWMAQFKDLEDARLASLKFSESQAGVRVEGVWRFPVGSDAPAHPQMEIFEYRDKTPQYVVDFWLKKGPTLAQVKASQLEAKRQAELVRSEREAKVRAERKLASQKRREAIETAAVQFCREPLSEKNDIFLPFYPFHEKVDLGRWVSNRMPDESYNYYAPSGKSEEHQYVRLILRLYREGKSALAMRTLDFFSQQYPLSNFRQEMKFLRASALLKLGHQAEAEKLLTELTVEASEQPVALQAALYLAAKQFERGVPLAALESFMWLSNHYPDHKLAWIFHLGAAEALFSMKQTERAAKEYQWVIENAPNEKAKIEAAARVGDLYLDRFHYEQALASYYQALSHFPSESKAFPSIYVNRGEVLYQLGQYDRAKEAFEDFLDRYGSHPSGWRAAFRLGEIQSRKGTPGALEAGRQRYFETINRYPLSPGATLARARLLPCGDRGGFDFLTMQQFFRGDAASFDGKGEVATKNYRDFRALSEVRALITFGKEDQAVVLALEEMKNNTMGEARPFLAKTISALFRKTILRYLAEGKKYEAVAFFKDKKDLLSRDSSPSELDYLLKLSQAASDLGLGEVGKELVEVYEKAAKQGQQRTLASGSVGTEEEDLEVVLRESEKSYSKARAIWINAALKPTSAVKKEVREILAAVREESPFSYQKELILAALDEMDGQLNAAFQHVSRAQILKPQSDDLRVEVWLASLNLKVGNQKAALSLYQDLEKRLALRLKEKKSEKDRTPAGDSLLLLGVPALPSLEDLLITQGEILEKLGLWGEAALAYGKIVENKWGGNRALYSYARSLMKTGKESDYKAGVATLQKVAASKEEDFWKSLAKEGLANQKSEQSIRNAKEGTK